MKPNARFAIGSQGERKVMEILQTWWGGEPWSTRTWGEIGPDITSPREFPFAVEVKAIGVARVKWFFRFGIAYRYHWAQTVRNARLSRRRPMLCMKCEEEWFVSIRATRLPRGLRLPHIYAVAKTPLIGTVATMRLAELIAANPRRDGKFRPDLVVLDTEFGQWEARDEAA